ncbi:uncharacterized protein LOC125665960 [Ostrea edulis]|uniref:uncharacterized protein LOC125665960 n=1 Tax=Ostrea edulis TaxID=37623 RepID=UPI00209481F3|nr:uncharacterized protein LOC125665960 [Ostrea edulis]
MNPTRKQILENFPKRIYIADGANTEADRGHDEADRGHDEAESSRTRARSVMNTKLCGVRPQSVTSTRIKSARKEDVSVLSHASLLTFSSFVNQHTIEQIALKLGVQKSVIHSIKTHVTSEVDGLREPIVVQNYHMLWSWRGRKATKKMVEQLLNVLRGINRWELAVVVSTAYKEHRRMRMSDFK